MKQYLLYKMDLKYRWSDTCIASIHKLRAEKYGSHIPEDVINTIPLL